MGTPRRVAGRRARPRPSPGIRGNPATAGVAPACPSAWRLHGDSTRARANSADSWRLHGPDFEVPLLDPEMPGIPGRNPVPSSGQHLLLKNQAVASDEAV